MKISFLCEEINHRKQKYATLGNYWLSQGKMVIVVSKMSHPGYTLAIIVHEMVEFVLCRLHGVKAKDITAFDLRHAQQVHSGFRPQNEEPGDAWDCPYRAEHQASTSVERSVIAAFGLDFEVYNKECEAMFD